MMKKLSIISVTVIALIAIATKSNAQVSEMEKLKARKEVLKKTTELNSLQIDLNKQMKEQNDLQLDFEKAKSEADLFAAKNNNTIGADVKAASKLAKLVKKSTKLSNKLTDKNVDIEKTKSKIEKIKQELNKLN